MSNGNKLSPTVWERVQNSHTLFIQRYILQTRRTFYKKTTVNFVAVYIQAIMFALLKFHDFQLNWTSWLLSAMSSSVNNRETMNLQQITSRSVGDKKSEDHRVRSRYILVQGPYQAALNPCEFGSCCLIPSISLCCQYQRRNSRLVCQEAKTTTQCDWLQLSKRQVHMQRTLSATGNDMCAIKSSSHMSDQIYLSHSFEAFSSVPVFVKCNFITFLYIP